MRIKTRAGFGRPGRGLGGLNGAMAWLGEFEMQMVGLRKIRQVKGLRGHI